MLHFYQNMAQTKKTVFEKAILYFCFVLIPILLFFVFSVTFIKDYLVEQNSSALERDVSVITSSLELIFENLESLDITLFNNRDVQKITNSYEFMSNFQRAESLNNIREVLLSLTTANSYISNIRIYFPDLNRVYNATGFSLGSFQEYPKSMIDNLLHRCTENGTTNYYLDAITEEYILTKVLLSSGTNPDFLIEFFIDIPSLENYIETQVNEEDSYILLLGNDYLLSNMDSSDAKVLLDSIELDNTILQNGYYITYRSFDNSADGLFVKISSVKLQENWLNTLDFMLISISVISFIGFLLYLRGMYLYVKVPLKKLEEAFSQLDSANFSYRLTNPESKDYKFLYEKFNETIYNLETLIINNYKKTILLQKSEMKQLQAQINPHFLYNNLFMVQRMIVSEVDHDARELVYKLGTYFRYLTKMKNDTVPLLAEYEHAKIYSDIQGERFQGRISVDFPILPKEFHNIPVPKLIIQPILENVFLYGLKNSISDGLLVISFTVDENCMNIVIEDNGEDLSDEKLVALQDKLKRSSSQDKMEMSGILNINKRLLLYSNDKIKIVLERSELGGLKVILKGFCYEQNTIC